MILKIFKFFKLFFLLEQNKFLSTLIMMKYFFIMNKLNNSKKRKKSISQDDLLIKHKFEIENFNNIFKSFEIIFSFNDFFYYNFYVQF